MMNVNTPPPHYEQTLAAMVLWREARGINQSIRMNGFRAILHVIKNRMADRRWPDTMHAVILQPYQFSSFNAKVGKGGVITCDPNAVKWPESKRPTEWQAFIEACAVVADPGPDNTGGANHYHDSSIQPPFKKWLGPSGTLDQLEAMRTARIGPLLFYKIEHR